MHKTRNDLTLDVRTRVSQLLNSRLASAIEVAITASLDALPRTISITRITLAGLK